MIFTVFFRKKSPFLAIEQFSKLLLGGATIGAQMAENFLKCEKMGAKFVRTTSTIYKRDNRKVLLQPFTLCIADVHTYKNISLPRYRVPRKTVKFVSVVPKSHGRTNVCAHRMSIKPCNLKKCFGGFL